MDWSDEVKHKLDLLGELPTVRYAFLPGFDRKPKGNSEPGSRLVRQDGNLALMTSFRSKPVPLSDLFAGFTLSIVTDGNGYLCVQGIDKHGSIRELAPALPAYYYQTDEGSCKLIEDNFTPSNKDEEFTRILESVRRVGPKVLASFPEGSMERNAYARLCEHMENLATAKVERIDFQTFLTMTPEQRQEKQRTDLEMVESLEREAANLFSVLRETGFRVPKDDEE